MKLLITIEVDGTDEYCEAVLDELELAVKESELITITSGGGPCEVAIVAVKEQPAVGRPSSRVIPFEREEE